MNSWDGVYLANRWGVHSWLLFVLKWSVISIREGCTQAARETEMGQRFGVGLATRLAQKSGCCLQ